MNPAPDEHPDPLGIVEDLDRLRQDVEQRDRDDDAARERDRRREVTAQAERRETPAEGCEDGDERERDRDPGHAQRAQSPYTSSSWVSGVNPCFRARTAADGAPQSSVSSTAPHETQTRWW